MTDTALINKLIKVLALTSSPNEGEAAAASAMLEKLLIQHNLEIADLEKKGASAPAITEGAHDLGKAAFRWKLNLADAIASHYYCYSATDHATKKVAFIGRPDNVEALRMLYGWLIDQIGRIASSERRNHETDMGERIDPLRWQVGFGLGAVERLTDRLAELKTAREQTMARDENGDVIALAIHHLAEVSDYLERTQGFRVDGRDTEFQRRYHREHEEREARLAQLKQTDIEAYYRERPWERPLTAEQQAAQDKENERGRKRQERNERRRKGRGTRYREESESDRAKRVQSRHARKAGFAAADRINLEPFLAGDTDESKRRAIRGRK
jgi:hypothetical protein